MTNSIHSSRIIALSGRLLVARKYCVNFMDDSAQVFLYQPSVHLSEAEEEESRANPQARHSLRRSLVRPASSRSPVFDHNSHNEVNSVEIVCLFPCDGRREFVVVRNEMCRRTDWSVSGFSFYADPLRQKAAYVAARSACACCYLPRVVCFTPSRRRISLLEMPPSAFWRARERSTSVMN